MSKNYKDYLIHLTNIGYGQQMMERKNLEQFDLCSPHCPHRETVQKSSYDIKYFCDHPVTAKLVRRQALGLTKLTCNMGNCRYVDHPDESRKEAGLLLSA